MKCPVCKKDSDFYNVDFEGYCHCPKCGAVSFDIETIKKNLQHKIFMEEVTALVREDDFSRVAV